MKRILPSLKHIKCIRTALSSRTTVSTLLSTSSSSFNISWENRDPSCFRYNWRSFSDIHLRCDTAHELQEESNRNVTLQENGEKEKFIKSASLKDLMQIAPTVGTPFQALLVLQRLNILHKEDINFDPVMILEDPCMSRVVEILDKSILKIPPKVLISCLNVLYEMTSKDIFLVKTLITQVIWLMKKLPISLLIQVLQLHLSHQETPVRKNAAQQAIVVLERRWVELTHLKDIIFLMYQEGGQPNSQTFTDRLEERALDLVEQASVKELYRILYILSRHRRRNMSLIRAVSYHLNKSDLSDLSAVQLSNLLYACAVLRLFDTPLMEKASLALQTKQGELTPKLAQSVLTSMSLLRWGPSQTVQYVVDQLNCRNWSSVLFHSDDECLSKAKDIPSLLSLGGADRVAIVMSLANLNKNNPMCCELVHKVMATPDVSELQKSSPFLWLDVVWSLAVLKLLNASLAASVLTEEFWGSLPVSDSFQSIVNFTKINNINTAAKYEIQGYTGPFLPDTFCHSDAKLLLRGKRKAAEKVISALVHVAPRDSYAILDATVGGGYVIDAEFFVDDNGEPQPLTKVGKSSSLFHRVALKVLDFPDLTLPDLEMTGLHAMAARHLSYQGFTVVHVLHTEISSKTKVLEMIQLLQQKIKTALKNKTSQPIS